MKTLHVYIRDEKGNPRGVVVCVRDGDVVNYGYSLVNNKKDKFSKKLGLEIAKARACAEGGYLLPGVRERFFQVNAAFKVLEGIALKYFKDLEPSKVALYVEDES